MTPNEQSDPRSQDNPSQSDTVAPVGWFDHPVLSLTLGASWLALSHSVALVHLLSALLLGLLIPRLLAPFLERSPRIHWHSAWGLCRVVLWDIVVSNVTVARWVLGPMQTLKPAWVRVPLCSRNPRLNALLASIITTTPGTVSAVVDTERQHILVHALHCEDEAGLVHDIHTRYQRPLLRVFCEEEIT